MKFTIGLPITKTKYLKESLSSIADQTFKDYEVIIKNNAATTTLKKEIKDICKDLMTKTNVQYFESDKQLSMTQNFNTIVEKAKGDYFMIMSDDDMIENNYLEEFNILTTKYPKTDVFHCRVRRIDGNNNLIDFSENCIEWESQIDFIYHRITSKRAVYLSDYVANTKALKEIGGFPLECSGWGSDEITWCRLAKNGIGFTPHVLLNYRRFLGNFSLSKENLLLRFKDVDFIHNTLDEIINTNLANNYVLYPRDYILGLNKDRTQKQKDYILEHYAKSTNLLGTLSFYFSNKKQISVKGLVKVLVMKTFFKDKFYNAA